MALDTDTATPEPGRRHVAPQAFGSRLAAALGRMIPAGWRTRVPPPAAESPSLLRRRRSSDRRYSPLTRRILLLNIVPVALLTLGAVYLSDYEDELIDAELASLRKSESPKRSPVSLNSRARTPVGRTSRVRS